MNRSAAERLPIRVDTVPPPLTTNWVRKYFGPWGGSALLHSILLLILLFWTIPIIQQGSLVVTGFMGSEDIELEEVVFSTEPAAPLIEDGEDSDLASEISPAELTIIDPELDDSAMLNEIESDSQDPSDLPDSDASLALLEPTIGGDGNLHGASTVAQAVDRITGGIRGNLAEGDLLVVWLLDASRSLVDDRERVADRLESFLREIEASPEPQRHRLMNAVVSFGAKVDEQLAPTRFIEPVLRSIRRAPVDPSGKENVLAAIEKCVSNYRRRWKSQMLFVVWTDESGDDMSRLERTIERCRRSQVVVSVVGPSAVLGADTGFHAYTDPTTNIVYQLPVTRGPDTVYPERLRLGYWFRTPPLQGIDRSLRDPGVRLPSWYGGDNLAGMASGFSPFGLTRLTLATGGRYTIFDRPEDRAPFDLQRMKDYLPSYESAERYLEIVKSFPLRRAVYEAVHVTLEGRDLQAPDLRLFGRISPEPPHKFEPFYFEPSEFQSRLRTSRRRLLRDAKHTADAVEAALAKVSHDGDATNGMEYEYGHEQSARWRAWYDLTRGRLLAASVRLEEYRLLCEKFNERDFLGNTTNCLVMLPSSRMRSDAKFAGRAEEAERLLMRCWDENYETPWAYLAERELQHELGISVRQLSLEPVAARAKSAPALPKF